LMCAVKIAKQRASDDKKKYRILNTQFPQFTNFPGCWPSKTTGFDGKKADLARSYTVDTFLTAIGENTSDLFFRCS